MDIQNISLRASASWKYSVVKLLIHNFNSKITKTSGKCLRIIYSLHVSCTSGSSWHLPHGISWWPWREHTGSRSSGESSRRSFHRSASPGGSLARKWHPSSSAPPAGTRRSCAGCSCTVELPPSGDWDQLLLKDTEKTRSESRPGGTNFASLTFV